MNIGVLLPRSNAHASLGVDFMNGLKVFTKHHELKNEFTFITESIGFGGTEKEVYGKAEKLLIADDVDILIGFVDEKVIDLLKPLLLSVGKLFIMVNPGANHPENWIPQSNIINLNLQHAFLCSLTGTIAANQNNKDGLIASTFFDCGYLHLAAMVRLFTNNGGNVLFNYINKQLYNDAFEIKELTDFLSANSSTTNLLCVFDDQPASLFYQRLNSYEDAGNLKLFVSPMMLEEKALQELNKGFKFSIDGYLSWHPSINNEANKLFLTIYQQEIKKESSAFSLLGWETAMILQQVYLNNKEDIHSGELIAETLKSNVLNSPRGELKLDPDSQHFIAPVIKCSVEKGSNHLQMEYKVNIEKEWSKFSKEPIVGAVSGWTNTYLCY